MIATITSSCRFSVRALLLAAVSMMLLAGCEKEKPAADEDEPIAVTSVQLTPSSLVLSEGEDASLELTVLPEDADDKRVVWSSSDEGVAAVDQTGKVTAVKEGKATVSVKSEDGGHEASCSVEVVPLDITADLDPTFAQALQDRGYIKDKNKILLRDVAGIKDLDISGERSSHGAAKALRGIRHFASLERLDVSYNDLGAIDKGIEGLTRLESIVAYGNNITSIILNISSLKTFLLSEWSNSELPLKTFELTAPELRQLSVRSDGNWTVDLGKYPKLQVAEFSNLNTAGIDLSLCPDLRGLTLNDIPLESLDLSKNVELDSVRISRTKVRKLDFSGLAKLKGYVRCDNNEDLESVIFTSANSGLEVLVCRSGKLGDLDISHLRKLTRFDCSANTGNSDGEMVVSAWFDNSSVPDGFINSGWTRLGRRVTLVYKDVTK